MDVSQIKDAFWGDPYKKGLSVFAGPLLFRKLPPRCCKYSRLSGFTFGGFPDTSKKCRGTQWAGKKLIGVAGLWEALAMAKPG